LQHPKSFASKKPVIRDACEMILMSNVQCSSLVKVEINS